MLYPALNDLLGNIDLYLLDQILKGRYEPSMCMLDAGCGEGRNLPYFVRNGFDVWGVDTNPTALRLLRLQGKSWGPAFDPEKFIESDLAKLPFPSARFEAIVCCAVLHFAHNEAHFFRMTDELLRVLKPSGSLFIRMNSSMDQQVTSTLSDSTYHFSSEEKRLLLTQSRLDQLIERYPLRLSEPPRTERVAGEIAQTTLTLKKD